MRSIARAMLFALTLAAAPAWGDAGGESGGVRPLPAALRDDLAELVAAAQRWRGLEAGPDVPAGVQDTDALRARLRELIAEELPPEVEPEVERALARFGLIPPGLDLSGAYLELLTEQVAGYFDPEKGRLVLVKGNEGAGMAGLPPGASPALAERLEDAVLVHEIVHLLQHRHFDLVAFLDSTGPLEDAALARAALVEGDASLVMFDFLLGVALARMPMLDLVIGQLTRDPAAMFGLMPGSEAMAAAPAFLRENLIFPYLHGLTFSLQLRKAGGQKLLDHAFRHDPPASSEQVLHPEKWLERRDEPVPIDLPLPSAVLGAPWRAAVAGSWGELNVRLILSEGLARAGGDGAQNGDDGDDAIRERAAEAAAGWGGDAFALWRESGGGGRETVVWITEWDDPGEALAFRAAAAEVFRYWHLRLAGTRVVLVSPDLEPARTRRVLDALMAAPARRTPGVSIDLEALGITDADRPVPLDPREMAAMAEDPVLAEMASLSVLADDPERKTEVVEDTLTEMVLDRAGIESSPAVREAIGSMLYAEPPAAAIDGGVLRIPELGMRMALPPWSAPDLPEGFPIKPVAMRIDPGSRWQLMVLAVPLPAPVGIDMLAVGLGMGLGAQGLEKTSDGFVTSGAQRGYALEARGTAPDKPIRASIRFYAVGGRLVQVQAMGPPESWARAQPAVEQAFASIAFE